MKIYLDDERHIPDNTWTRFYTAHAVIDQMDEDFGCIEKISLDYYLGSSMWGAGCGQDVMEWLKEMVFAGNITKLPEIEFHTSSRSAYRMMERTLFTMWDYLDEN